MDIHWMVKPLYGDAPVWDNVEFRHAPRPEELCYYTEVLINREICIPPQKPDVEEVVHVSHRTSITKVTPVPVRLHDGCVAGCKVLVQGNLRLGIEYSADVPDQEVHYAHFNLPFEGLIMDGACQRPIPLPNCDPKDLHVHIYVEHLQVCPIDHRKLLVVVVLLIWLKAKCCPYKDDDWDDDKDKCCPEPPRSVSKEIALNPRLRLPEQKPSIEEILSHDVELELTHAKLINTPLEDPCERPVRKVIIIGEAALIIKYAADTPGQHVHAAHFVLPFSTLIEWPGGPPTDTPLTIYLTLEYSHVSQCGPRGFEPVLAIRIDVLTKH